MKNKKINGEDKTKYGRSHPEFSWEMRDRLSPDGDLKPEESTIDPSERWYRDTAKRIPMPKLDKQSKEAVYRIYKRQQLWKRIRYIGVAIILIYGGAFVLLDLWSKT